MKPLAQVLTYENSIQGQPDITKTATTITTATAAI